MFRRLKLWLWQHKQRRKYRKQHSHIPAILEHREDTVISPELEVFLHDLFGPVLSESPVSVEPQVERVEPKTLEFVEWDDLPPSIRTD